MRLSRLLTLLLLADFVSLAALAANELHIDQVNQKFSQSSAQLKVGDVIVFQNSDDVTHNVNISYGDEGPEDQGLQKPGEMLRYTFGKAGSYLVRCSIHPRMKMTVAAQ